MALGGQGRDHANLRKQGCVGPVDDAGRSFAARDQCQRAPRVRGAGQSPFQGLPLPQTLQGLLGIEADRNVVRIADRKPRGS